MTNTACTHVSRIRRLTVVATSALTLGGFAGLAIDSARSGNAAANGSCAPAAGTPTATTAVVLTAITRDCA